MKIYIHHYYSEDTFYKLAHNTTDKEFNITNQAGSVKCKYKGTEIEFIFKIEMSDETDGYHLLDLNTIISQNTKDIKFENITQALYKKDVSIDNIVNNPVDNLCNLLEGKTNWIIMFFNGEKTLFKYENVFYKKNMDLLYDIENSFLKLKNHKIVLEEVFIKDEIRLKYSNFYYTFSNSMWYWNFHAEIRWYYEFKKIYDKLNFDYDLCFSIRSYKYNRILLLNELKKLNNNRIFLQRSDARKNSELNLTHENKVTDIYLNSMEGDNDFDNLHLIHKNRLGLDLFYRVLNISKMQILDESWSWADSDFASHYLSEKTIGFVLSGIPFISTHSYPLEVLNKILDIPPHPFYNESKKIKGDAVKIAEFVKEFMENFDENYTLCKEWSDICHIAFMDKFYNENSLLDLMINDFKYSTTTTSKLI
jgi:hypothetical protein